MIESAQLGEVQMLMKSHPIVQPYEAACRDPPEAHTASMRVGVQRIVVRKWARRFLARRLDGAGSVSGRGAKGRLSAHTYCHHAP
jgi:hypothetical protein